MSQAGSLSSGGGGGGSLNTLTGNTGGAVNPTASNINVIGSGNITTTGSGSTLTISQTMAQVVGYTQVNFGASPYTVTTDYFIGVDATGGAVTILLPNAPTAGRIFAIKDVAGIAATNNITITTVGGTVTIDGATSFVMNTAYESASLIFSGTFYEVY
jgi:hypothetical protein